MRYRAFRFGLALALLAALMSFAMGALADAGQIGSLKLTVRDSRTEQPVHDGSVTLHQVAGVSPDGSAYVLTAEFAGSGASLDDLEAKALVERLAAWTASNKIAGTTKNIGSNGAVSFSNLERGLYLVTQEKAATGYVTMMPFLVTVPMKVDGKWVYDVDAYPKAGPVTPVTTPPTTTTPPGGGGPTPTPRPTTQLSGKKVWVDDSDKIGVRPSSVTIELLANGRLVDSQHISGEGDEWDYSFNNLPELDGGGRTIAYTVREIPVEYYETSVSGTTITNTLEKRDPTYTRVEGKKTWNDNGNADGQRPDSIVVRLIRNGEQVDSRTVFEANGWRYSFEDLIADNGYGTTYTYMVREDTVPGYFQQVDGYDITNSRLPDPPPPDEPPRRTPPEYSRKTEEELEGLIELFDYDTPLWGGLLQTGDETPLYAYIFGGVGIAAAIALGVLIVIQRKRRMV